MWWASLLVRTVSHTHHDPPVEVVSDSEGRRPFSWLGGGRDHEVQGHVLVLDDLAVAGPGADDGSGRADAGGSRIAARSEAVVLRRARGAGSHAHVGGAHVGASQHLALEGLVVAGHAEGQTMRHALQQFQHQPHLVVAVLEYDLRRREELFGDDPEDVVVLHGLDRRQHGRGLERAVALRNGVVDQRLTTEQQPGVRNVQQCLHVAVHLVVVHSQHRADGQVVESAAHGQLLSQLQVATAAPVGVRQGQGFGAALLAGRGEGILVGLVAHEVQVVRIEVRPQQLDVEAGVFQLDAAVQQVGQALGRVASTRELQQGHVVSVLRQELVHGAAATVHDVHVLGGQATVDEEPHELLQHDAHDGSGLDDGEVAHVQGTHQLQRRDLQREVEGCDYDHRAVGPAVAVGLLSVVVPGHAEARRQLHTHAIAGEVLQEDARDRDLTHGLGVGLGHDPHDQPGEELGHLGLVQLGRGPGRHPAQHAVALHVQPRVVLAVGGAVGQPLSELGEVACGQHVVGKHVLSGQRVQDRVLVAHVQPLPGAQRSRDRCAGI